MDSFTAVLEELPEVFQNQFDIREILLGFDPDVDTIRTLEFMNQYSPINYLNIGSPPTLIIHGTEDRLVPLEQSLDFKEKLDSLECDNEMYILEGVDHAFIGASKVQKDSVQIRIRDFVLKQFTGE